MKNKINVNKELEQTKPWHELNDFERECLIVSHAEKFRTGGINVSNERVARLMELGRPKAVFAYENGKVQYYRIHKESVDVMKVLFNNYLQKTVIEEIEDEFPDMLEGLE